MASLREAVIMRQCFQEIAPEHYNKMTSEAIKSHMNKKVRDTLNFIKDTLKNGLDIGGIKRSIIKVEFCNTTDYGYCFYAPSNKSYYPLKKYKC